MDLPVVMISREKRNSNSIRTEFTVFQRCLVNPQYLGKINLKKTIDSLLTSWGMRAIKMHTLK